MCGAVVQESDWLDISTWEADCKCFVDFTEVLAVMDKYLHALFTGRKFTLFYVCGGGKIYHMLVICFRSRIQMSP